MRDRKAEAKHGSLVWMAPKGQCSMVCFDDGAADGQTHTSARLLHAVSGGPIELLEDEALLTGIDADTAVGDTGDYVAILLIGGDDDGRIPFGIFCRVFKQIAENFCDHHAIGGDRG